MKSKAETLTQIVFSIQTNNENPLPKKIDDTFNTSNEIISKISCPEELKSYIPKAIQEYKEILEEYERWKKFIENDPGNIVQYPILTLPKIQRDPRDLI